jgi:hypothetical protein
LALAALVGCNNNTSNATDTGTPGTDSGTPGTDSGTPGTDSGTPDVDSGTPGTDAGRTDPTCAAYCTAITASCTGANRQYGTSDGAQMDACMTACGAFGWMTGTAGDTSGNTLGCRLYHATAAAGSDANHMTHCPHAGPLGGGVCGTSDCVDFCAADAQVCSGTYATMDACVAACATWSDASSVQSPTTTSGNTLSCRTYHLTAAAASGGAATHCPHTGLTGGGVCM